MSSNNLDKPGFAGRIAAIFVNSRLTPVGILASLLLGLIAIVMLPREEEPQIKVPMIDVMVSMPGATPKEVEERLSVPMEKLLYELPGVEYIYSTSMAGQSMLVVRFYVGADLESSIVRLNQKLATNFDRIPHGVSFPLIKPHIIDDVPILALTFHSKSYDHYTLRRMAAQVNDAIKSVHKVAETTLIGGTRRQVRVLFDPLLLAARNLTVTELVPKIQQANRQDYSGRLETQNQEILLQTGKFLSSAKEIGRLVVGIFEGSPVYLDEVAQILDGPEEPDNYVLFGEAGGHGQEAAVTLSIAKRPGANAVSVVEEVMRKVESLKGTLIPADIEVTVTRDYGATAAEKSNELLLHMGIAVFGVALLILFFLGWRESTIVMLAIPSTLALTLLVFYLYGYTLNRITLFALIFSIGILVDDAIVVVENIVRHMRLPASRDRSLVDVAVEAVIEVGNPTILATWAVIAAILPMAFVGGLMGPYMRPIPIGSSAAMIFSLIIAFTVTPWAATHILKKKCSPSECAVDDGHTEDHAPDDWFTKLYHRIMDPLLASASWRLLFFAVIISLLLATCSMVYFGLVKVKMLPFDNKSEFQVILNMPEGSTLEQTSRVALEMAEVIKKDPAVINYQVYAGTASPYNFNGLVRHYFMRSGPTVADIQVNLRSKHERDVQSHAIAVRVRPELAVIAKKYGAAVAVAEVPPGPPVLQTLVAEIYGPTDADRVRLAEAVKGIFESSEGVVDVDWYRETERKRLVLTVDKEKAALNGITEDEITRTVHLAVQGKSIDLFHQPADKEEINMVLELPRALRARVDGLLNISLRSSLNSQAPLVPLRELVRVSNMAVDQPIYRKNLKPVIYVTGDVAGTVESPVYAIFEMNKKLAALKGGEYGGLQDKVQVYNLSQPFSDAEPSMKWDGEWHITLEVFRDLGLAFCVVMILIYMLMVGWFKDYITPLVVMAAIPFSLIGILPAHWGFGAFFTATSMIGFMAGAGIVVRNSIILVDFIELRISHGLPLAEAVVEAGAIRFRPMLLTALAVVVGASVILADPIFQGLAISLMFGEIASLLISRMAVPVLYFMLKNKKKAHA
ncbi:MAG: efflux RND transporter permease subunit [Proteobacteria bacterium]|jgi:multidrug efflux pump subunit AcrB|nr:efflux RND transporter permease subunit [Desulfocapsa sp.]MBU3944668.1 efflux RND transporter permease subunit [Pseudomonadota bacterium]MCG2743268.1 efflux RND transporter permease subunit [Desulfobacteraceae bacterium]MBU3982569.1 efflux RND transporter permease subunit [Pseudomonadota bacterium]MBU4030315.1 efflux RND transporter permease subunit [Pseudomonadota bacterium]